MKKQKKSNWGGKRQNAGRKKSEITKKTVVVRVDEELITVIAELKEKYKSGCNIDDLIKVTNTQDELEALLTKQSNRNLELVLQRDKEHLQAVKLKGQVLSLKNTIKSQKEELEAMHHKIYDCQALKKDGGRCTRPAKLKTNWQGVEINVCIQHSKSNG